MEEIDSFLSKVEMIMDSPTERSKFKSLGTFEEKISFLRDHFIMDELAIRLLERKYLLSEDTKDSLIGQIDYIVKRSEH